MPTKIEWCNESINPVKGCSKCSPGCDNCYAENMAYRLSKNPKTAAEYAGLVDESGRWTGEISGLDLSVFDRLPKKPCSVFVGSMTDIFHENNNFIDEIINACWDHIHHTFLILTKRSERMSEWMNNFIEIHKPYPNGILPNIWFGVTVCNQKEADKNIPHLLNIPSVGHFISIEPMLGPIDLTLYFDHNFPCQDCGHREPRSACECPACGFVDTSGNGYCPTCKTSFPNNAICVCTECGGDTHSPSAGLDCVIVGGETGPKARPMHPDWVRSVRDQCAAAGVPFFFKGWGKYQPYTDEYIGKEVRVLTDKLYKRLLDGVEHNERPW